jgi:hypothetical protein
MEDRGGNDIDHFAVAEIASAQCYKLGVAVVRRSYWLDLSDRSIVLVMTQGIGTRVDRRREAGSSHRYPTAAPDRHHPATGDASARQAALIILN